MNVGDKNNFLTMIGEKVRKEKKTVAMFRCECGTEKEIIVGSVKRGETKSCGCYNRIAASQRMKDANKKTSHGLLDHPLYNSWVSMKNRCNNPKVKGYLNGIKYVEDWETFINFYNWAINHWSEDMVMHRKDSERDFGPDNCYFGKRDPVPQNEEKRKQTCLEKYGVEHPQQSQKVRDAVVKTNIEKYGCIAPSQNENIKAATKERNIKKYGVENPAMLDSVKEQTRQNNIEKYGVEYPQQLQEYKDKMEMINIEKYGVKTNLLLPETKEQIKKTCLERYGAENPLMSEQIQESIRQKSLERYGVESPLLAQEVKDRVKQVLIDKYGTDKIRQIPGVNEKIRATNIERYGVDNPWKNKDIQYKCAKTKQELYPDDYYYHNSSIEEISVLEFANSFGYTFNSDWDVLRGRQLDMYCPELKLAIEYNGVYFHSEISNKGEFYHYNKFVDCASQGICLIFIWGDDWRKRNDFCKELIMAAITKTNHPIPTSDKIENGLGIELFADKKFIRYENPDYWLLDVKDPNYRISKDEFCDSIEYSKVWNAGYSIYK